MTIIMMKICFQQVKKPNLTAMKLTLIAKVASGVCVCMRACVMCVCVCVHGVDVKSVNVKCSCSCKLVLLWRGDRWWPAV